MLDKDGSVIVPQFTLSSQSLYNDIQLDLDTPTELSSLGALTVPASQVDAQTNTAVAYVALWPKADDFTQSRFIARLGTTTYGSELATLKPAVARTSEFSTAVETKQYNVWFNDDENTIADVLGGVLQSVNWIRKDGNSIVVEENKTGRMRTGTIELDNGVSYIVTQLGPNMFKGVWTLRSRRFNPNGTAPGPKGTTSAHEQSVSFGEPRLGETLVDADGKSHTNNIGITGLYGDAVLEACVDIDYENRTIAFGIFFDRRKAQSAGNGKYVAILPELAAASCAWTGYNFAPGSKVFSDNDYEWLWFNIDEEFKTLHYVFYQKGQLTSNKKYSICGISCVAAKGEDASTIGSAYDVIYQANYNGSNADGLKFLR